MNKSLQHLCFLAQKEERRWIGILSGTSQDGVDVGCFKIKSHGLETSAQQEHFETLDYPDVFKKRLNEISYKRKIDQQELVLMNAELGRFYAKVVLDCLDHWKLNRADVDAIASHGQTVFHAPQNHHGDPRRPHATLQIGDGDHIAQRTGLPVVHDFRQKHVAAGGEGAPLAVYLDHLLFHKKGAPRVMLNIGGIANFTWLDGSGRWDDLLSTDTGPGNTLLDAVVRKRGLGKFDKDGRLAAQGQVNTRLLNMLMSHSFFTEKAPKSTGPEAFSKEWLDKILEETSLQQIKTEDLLATLTQFTAQSIADTVKAVSGEVAGIEVLVSGGGVHNAYLMNRLQESLPRMKVKSLVKEGIDPDAKEALLFAMLGNECVAGEGFPAPGGSGEKIHFGKISLP